MAKEPISYAKACRLFRLETDPNYKIWEDYVMSACGFEDVQAAMIHDALNLELRITEREFNILARIDNTWQTMDDLIMLFRGKGYNKMTDEQVDTQAALIILGN